MGPQFCTFLTLTQPKALLAAGNSANNALLWSMRCGPAFSITNGITGGVFHWGALF